MRITARVDQLVNLTERAINGDGGSHGFIGTFKKKITCSLNYTDAWPSFPETLL